MSTDDHNADLEAIRARYAASTPGTWRHGQWQYELGTPGRGLIWKEIRPSNSDDISITVDGSPVCQAGALSPSPAVVGGCGCCGSPFGTAADGEFIAHAHQDIPLLLDEVVRLRAENAALEAVVDQLRAYLTTSSRGVEAFDAMCAAMKAYDGTEPVP